MSANHTVRMQSFNFTSLDREISSRLRSTGMLKGHKIQSNSSFVWKKSAISLKQKQVIRPVEVLGGFLKHKNHSRIMSRARFIRASTAARSTVRIGRLYSSNRLVKKDPNTIAPERDASKIDASKINHNNLLKRTEEVSTVTQKEESEKEQSVYNCSSDEDVIIVQARY